MKDFISDSIDGEFVQWFFWRPSLKSLLLTVSAMLEHLVVIGLICIVHAGNAAIYKVTRIEAFAVVQPIVDEYF